ncbi:NAD-dependent epimerase/dehydratase family protein [Candidatus Pelagibacter ubique]|uniref:NAD-dependent epimerase/dehydratase family protein n=1 Tax=Pelagibacter ubique TaxID=198252 RepID=UPI0003D1A426
MKKFLIVGASGFIGSNILNLLPIKIDLTIVTSKKKKIIEKIKKKNFSKITIKNYTFISFRNKDIIQEIDVIINCTGAYPKKNNIKKLIFLNYKLPKLLFDLSVSKKPKQFININTLLKNRKSTYVKYKHKLSDYFKSKLENTKVIDLFIGHLYGDTRNKKEFIYSMMIKILKKEKKLNFTKGQQKRDFIHIKDFRNLFKKILKTKLNKKYSKFDISSFKNYSIKSVILLIKKITRSNIDINFGYFKYRKGEDFAIKGDIKTLSRFNWNPKIKLSNGIKLLWKEIKIELLKQKQLKI